MKPLRYACLALWLTSALYAVGIDGPSEAEGQRTVKHKIKDLPPKTGHKWTLEALDGQDLTKVEWIAGGPKAKEIHWIGPLGRYRLILETLSIVDGVPDWDRAEKVVTLGKGEPPPPAPDDPLVKAIQAAYDADAAADKAKNLAFLASLYGVAGPTLDEVSTLGELQSTLQKARRAKMPDTALVGVRKVVNAELEKLGTVKATPLTDDLKKEARATFAKISAALKGVK